MRTHKELIRALEDSGHSVVYGNRGHLKVLRANGSYAMTMAGSPGDKNATNKARLLATRLGLLDERC